MPGPAPARVSARVPARVRALSLMLAALVLLLAAPPAPAQTDVAPQTIGGEPVVQIAAASFHSCARVLSGQCRLRRGGLCWPWVCRASAHGAVGSRRLMIR